MIDEDLPHQSRRDRTKVRAILQRHSIEADESQKRLVDEIACLQRVSVPFRPQA